MAKKVFNGLLMGVVVATLLEVITGFVLLPSFSLQPSGAYASVKAMEANPGLHFLISFHHWLSAVLIVFTGAALLFGLWTAAYRMSSRVLWVCSVLMFVSFMLLQLTGHLLPWDQHAVRTAVVETSIAQGAPVVGSFQAHLLRGGNQVGPATLPVWFWAHAALLSLFWLVLAVIVVRKSRFVGYSTKALVTSLTLIVAGAIVGAAALAVEVGPAATTMDYTSYIARPEWYVLPLHSLLDLFQRIGPSFAFIGTMLIPALALLLVMLAPWLDLRKEVSRRSVYGPVLGLLLFVGTIVLFGMSANNMASLNGPNVQVESIAVKPNMNIVLDPQLVAQGKKQFTEQSCSDCHKLAGQGGEGGPPLDGEGNRHPSYDWQYAHLSNPPSQSPGSTMPAYSKIGPGNLKAISEYLMSLK